VQGGYYIKAWGKHGQLTNRYAFGFFPHMPHTGENADRLTHTFDVYGGGLLGPALEGKIIGPNPIMSRVSVSALKPTGSTFETTDDPPMLTSDDGWFRPVDLKTGPDGALYLADLYERRINHVDPRDNWHRESGRIWRIRPASWRPGYAPFDLASESNDELVKRLDDKNRWYRATARRILADRRDPGVVPSLRKLLANGTGRLAIEALWALNACGGFDEAAARAGLNHGNPAVRAWTLRLLTDEPDKPLAAELVVKLVEMAGREGDPEVRAQLASSAKRMNGGQAVPVITGMLGHASDCGDAHIPLLLWWAVESKAVARRDEIVSAVASGAVSGHPLVRDVILQRLSRRYASEATPDNQRALVRLFDLIPDNAGQSSFSRESTRRSPAARFRRSCRRLPRRSPIQATPKSLFARGMWRRTGGYSNSSATSRKPTRRSGFATSGCLGRSAGLTPRWFCSTWRKRRGGTRSGGRP
jgi:hypothetical protein